MKLIKVIKIFLKTELVSWYPYASGIVFYIRKEEYSREKVRELEKLGTLHFVEEIYSNYETYLKYSLKFKNIKTNIDDDVGFWIYLFTGLGANKIVEALEDYICE